MYFPLSLSHRTASQSGEDSPPHRKKRHYEPPEESEEDKHLSLVPTVPLRERGGREGGKQGRGGMVGVCSIFLKLDQSIISLHKRSRIYLECSCVQVSFLVSLIMG